MPDGVSANEAARIQQVLNDLDIRAENFPSVKAFIEREQRAGRTIDQALEDTGSMASSTLPPKPRRPKRAHLYAGSSRKTSRSWQQWTRMRPRSPVRRQARSRDRRAITSFLRPNDLGPGTRSEHRPFHA